MRTTRVPWTEVLALAIVGVLAPLEGRGQEPGHLLTAAMYDEIDTVKELLAAGADIDQQNECGHTPLILAATYGYEELGILLVAEGADVNIQGREGGTALIAASRHSRPLVELLLSKGADIHTRMADGTGPFTQCTIGILTEEVGYDLATLLLSHGAEVDESAASGPMAGYTPLMMAARNDHEGLVRFLIENGADVREKAGDGATALSLAMAEGHETIVEILEAAGGSQPPMHRSANSRSFRRHRMRPNPT